MPGHSLLRQFNALRRLLGNPLGLLPRFALRVGDDGAKREAVAQFSPDFLAAASLIVSIRAATASRGSPQKA